MATTPNILLITTDQQRFDTCGPDAPDVLLTPHLDDLARRGIRYSAAYSDCPLCVPARVSIMTGKQPFEHGLLGNGNTCDYMGREETLPGRMRALGYQTAAIGKMHFSPERARHGFDEMILPADYYREMERSGNPLQPMRHGLGQNELFPGLATVPEPLTLTSWITERCVDYLRERRDPTAPFFLWCSYSKPHPPLDPPEPYYSMYRGETLPDPIASDWTTPHCLRRVWHSLGYDAMNAHQFKVARAAYYGLITHIDYNLGRLFAALDDSDELDETLILFTSDHGELLGDHGGGAKACFYEGASHVPFILKLPDSWENRCPGKTDTMPVTHSDILPTLVAAAGGTTGADVSGLNLLDPNARRDKLLLQMNWHNRPMASTCLTDGRWKYLYYPEEAQEQLFDLAEDPDEVDDLAANPDHAKRLAQYRQELIERHAKAGTGFAVDGDLYQRDPIHLTEEEMRRQTWAGYNTEHIDKDTKH